MNLMTDTTLTRSIACNLVILAHLPTEDLVAAVFALEDRPLPCAPSAGRGIAIQRELAVLALFRGYIASGLARGTAIREEAREKLLTTPLERFVAPPGEAIRLLRTEYLVDPDFDLGPELAKAAALQAANGLPTDVPPLGRILTRAQTHMAPDEQPLVAPPAMKAILMAQACLRAMLDVPDRKPGLLMRTAQSDPAPLRDVQTVANAILASNQPHTPAETAAIAILCETARAHLDALGFPAFAAHMREFVQVWARHVADPEAADPAGIDAVTVTTPVLQGDALCQG